MEKNHKTKLGIIFGGKSGEHEISLTSAASVIRALDPREYDITVIGITKQGKLANAVEVRQMLPTDALDRVVPFGALDGGDAKMRLISSVSSGKGDAGSAPEIYFPLMHGPYGEDGTIQGLLEVAGFPYIGCGVLASAVGMDKDVMKRLFLHAGLPVAPYLVVDSASLETEIGTLEKAVVCDLGYPVFSKPANLGSSVGVCKIHDEDEFEESVRHSAQFDHKILIEKGINAREVECAILGNWEPQASVVGEVLPAHEFYDYDAKYISEESRLEIPARIPEAAAREVRDIAVRAFKTINGSGLARVDFFLERGTDKIWLNEINTMPGFTPISMYAKLWAASGTDFRALVRRLVELAFERHRERNELRISQV
jgi:D-alanine-D-alanine ligase